MSSRKSTYEAVVFCRYALGVEELDLCVKSRRCLGSACHGEVRPKNRAAPLTVAELGILHDRLENAPDAWDRVFSGAVLLCTYMRARWSDLMHAEGLVYDYDNLKNLAYVECPVAYHKNMRSRVMRHDLLPMVAPGLGVVGPNWARLWKLARQELGLVDPPDFPVMPAPDKSGSPTVRPLDTEEMGRWLRCILTGSSSKQGERKLSSHSCKCTMLSYAAKRGISIMDRQLLGYHTTPHRMALTYSRDSAAHPLMILGRLIGEIREKKFFPDETRSGRLVGDAGEVPSGTKAPVVVVKDEEVEESSPTVAEAEASPSEHPDSRQDEEVNDHVTTGDQALHTKLCEQGIKNFKTLAFAIGSPQQPPTEAQFEAFSVRVYGSDPTMGQTAVLRHLHFEATTLVVQTYRDMVTHDPSDLSHTRKVPVPEKRARLDMQRRRLTGMEISGELEPSHQLLDLINQQYESGIITWVPASKCSKREAEILAGGKDKGSLLQVEQNVIKVGQGEPQIACDVSDPLRFQWAMMRRGLAFDSCHMISWDVHQKWVQKMLDCLSMTPPPGYSAVTLNQCMRADKELFLLLAREASPPFKVDSLGVSPLDVKFTALIYDVRLQQYLLHMQKATSVIPTVSLAEVEPCFTSDVASVDCDLGTAAAGGQGSGKLDGGEKLALAKKKAAAELSCVVEPGLRCKVFLTRLIVPVLVPFTQCLVSKTPKPLRGGALWVQSSEGVTTAANDPSLTGKLIPISEGPAFLMDPSVPHETRDWTGTRVVLIAYSVLGGERLASDMAAVIVSQKVPKSVGDMFFIEITSGSAEVTKAAAAMGFGPFAVSVVKP
ncbi:unnamed protein product [Symbiodinium microadriaticum]|nr:unnamed protein product [Symbiodinium microadriaticum]